MERFYDVTARLLNCQPDEIAFVENATRAWDMAFYSIPFQAGGRILTAQAEYASNFIPYLQVARKSGAKVEVIPSDKTGQVSVSALKNMLDERVKLIAITHVPTNGGLVNPAAEIGAVARELDLTASSVGNWVKQARADRSHGQTGLTTAEREELARLRKENRILLEEREILKKATAFFAKQSE